MFWRIYLPKRSQNVQRTAIHSQPPHVSAIGYWTFTKWSIDSCQNRITTDQYHMSISRAHVSAHRGDVIYLEAVR